MDGNLSKRGYYLPQELLDAWAKFHAPSRDYSPSAAGAFLVWMALEAELREKARRAAYSSNIEKAVAKVRKLLSQTLVDAEIKAELAGLTPARRTKLLVGARKADSKSPSGSG